MASPGNDPRPVRLYRAVLRLYPRWWRERYGDEVTEVFRRRLAERAGSGSSARAGWLVREVAGAVAAAIRVRMRGDGGERVERSRRGGGGRVDGMMREVRYAVRSLSRSPGFTATAVAVLALGIGAATAIFSVADAVLLRPLPFPEPDRLVMLWEHNPEKDWWRESSAPANVLDWREGVDAFEDVAFHGWDSWSTTYLAAGRPVELQAMSVTGNFFDVLGVPAALGRTLRREETWSGGSDVIVLAHRAWLEHFGADPAVVGRTVEIGGSSVEVVGVMPAGFTFPVDGVDLWTPWGWDRSVTAETWFRRAHFVWPVARLEAGVTPEEADAELQGVVRRLQEEHPETNRAMGAHLTPLHDFLVGDSDRPLHILLGAVALLLLVACANVGNLLLVRASGRARELAVRRAMGAGRGRVAFQLVLESLLLAVVGGALGLVLGAVGVRVLSALQPIGLDGVRGVTVDGRVAAFGLALALASGLLFALLPAVRAGRADAMDALRGSRGGSADRSARRAVEVLVVAEVAVALVLVAGAGLLGRSFTRLASEPGGFRTEGILTFELSLPSSSYDAGEDALGFWRELDRRVEALPGVRGAAIASDVPLLGSGWTSDYSVEEWLPERFGAEVHHRTVSPDYFRLMEVPVVRGRLPGPGGGPDGISRILVNEAFVREAFPDGSDPVGRRVANDRVPDGESVWRTIVGVVADERVEALGRPPRPEIFTPLDEDAGLVRRVLVRADGPPLELLPALRDVVHELDPRLPLTSVLSMREIEAGSLARERFLLFLVAAFGGTALLLAAVGVYGVTAQAGRRRAREIGVRVAMGAEPAAVRWMILLRGAGLAVAGIGLGLLGALGGGRLLRSVLYETPSHDAATLVGVALLLGAVTLLASWIPAFRATRVDPTEVLRTE